MKRSLLILALAGIFTSYLFAQSSSQTPFDKYVKSVRSQLPGDELVKAASHCSLDLTKSQVIYGTNNGSSFTPAKDFAKRVYSLESDFFSTAALWVQGSNRLIDLWSINDSEGSESNYIICLDTTGNATSMQMTSWFMPLDPSFPGWKCTRFIKFDSGRALIEDMPRFVDLASGKIIRKPQLDSDQQAGLDWIPGKDNIHDILSQLTETRKK